MPKLPVGTITFLFTDIEGSTLRWERYPEEMRVALARHDEILRTIASDNAGVVFKTVGDAFYVVFATAGAAISAALVAQKVLSQEKWHETIAPLRVRMAIHTGEAEKRGQDYFGQSLNRVARILSSGHGGQILLSTSTAGLVRDHLPLKVRLKDLGTHRLKDIQSSEQIFQLVVEELENDFPPLKTLDHHPNNLPTQLTPFVGRKKDLAAIGELLRQDRVRLVTLIGPGGVGKTRLGLQAAAEIVDIFPGGIYFIDLAVVRDRDGVVAALAQAIGVRESNDQSLLENVKTYLQEKALLLIDNFEQVLDASPIIHDILVKFHQIKVLVTSRSPLHLGGEHEYHVTPLVTPDYKQRLDVVELTQYEAVALFVQQAKAVKPDFHLSNANGRAVAEICARLDGLPLAIELAAARVKLLPPQMMLKRLGHGLQLLGDEKSHRIARQQTWRGAIAWSYELLDEHEKALFCQLSIFCVGCTLEAVESVCMLAQDSTVDMLDVLRSLIDKSLLRLREQEDGEPRFEMLYTLREYALGQLVPETSEQLRSRHAQYYLQFVEYSGQPSASVSQEQWLRQLEIDYENIQFALSWYSEHDQIESGLRLAIALWHFWWLRGLLREGRRWFDKLLTSPGIAQVEPAIQAKAFERTSELACNQQDYAYAATLAREALRISRELDDRELMSNAYVALASAILHQGESQQAVALLEESLKLRQMLGDVRGMASLLNNLGNVSRQQGKFEQSARLHDKSLVYFRQLGDEMAIAAVLNNLAEVEWCREHHEQAARLYEESLELCRRLRYSWGIASSLVGLADAAAHEGKDELARSMYKESLVLFQEMDDQSGIAACVEGLTHILRRQYQMEAQVEVAGYAMDSDISNEDLLRRMRVELGEETFNALKMSKRIDSLDQTIEDAFEGLFNE